MSSPDSRTVLVTGASRGIGAVVARGLAADGHRVAFAARDASTVAEAAAAHGGMAVALDVTDPEAIERAVAEVAARLGPVEVLVNNAGVAGSAPFGQVSDALWDQLIAVNLTAPFRLARACVPGMLARGWGRVVFVASNAGLTGYAYTSAYCASKHGVVGLMRAMAVELARTGVTVNAVCPGFVETDMAHEAIARIQRTTGRTEAEARAALERLNPQNRMVQPVEVLHLVRSLVAEDARGINGQALTVDGGQVLH